MFKSWKVGLVAGFMALMVSNAFAGAITCEPSNLRVAILTSAESCYTANSLNINDSADINGLLGTSDTWVKKGELTAAGINNLFTVTADSWGTNVHGTWSIDASFWSVYGSAAISMHVGNGGGNPDAFLWLITPGQTSGTFSYERVGGSGGGLSNLFLFGTGTPNIEVPESNIVFLLLFGLMSILIARRRAHA